MTTVLFADRDGHALGPLGERIVPALLPVQGVPLLERTIRALVASGIKTVLLVTGPRAAEIERRFGKGIRWGIALNYVRREDGESCSDVLRRLEQRLDGETLVVRGDVGAHEAVSEFVREAPGTSGAAPIVAAVVEGRPAGLWRLAPGALKKMDLPRDPGDSAWALDPSHTVFDLPRPVTLVDSVAAWRRVDRAEKPLVADRAEVDPTATLLAGTTVADESTVLAGARLLETAVLPRTVIPGGLSLENAAVQGNLVVEVPAGATSQLTDRLPAPRPRTAGFGSRVSGALALFLSLPLWPVAFGWSLLANAGHATRRVVLSGNSPGQDAEGRPRRAPLPTFLFETAVPVLRDLPLLLAVVSGRLAMTGVTPLPPADEAAAKEPWESARLEAPAGLVSWARLVVPASAPPEVARLVDAFQARQGDGGLRRAALAALFSARAWTAPRVWNPDVPPEAGAPS